MYKMYFFLAGTPKPLSRSASPHIPNQQQIKQSSSQVPLKAVSLSEESSSSSSSSGRYVKMFSKMSKINDVVIYAQGYLYQ